MSQKPYAHCPYMGASAYFDSFQPINWLTINNFELYQLYTKGRPELHILRDLKLNIY